MYSPGRCSVHLIALGTCLFWLCNHEATAQAPARRAASASKPTPPPGSRSATPTGSPSGQADQEKAEADKTKSSADGESKSEAESPEPKVIRRGTTTDAEADPEELQALVGEDGRVAFQFRNQPWVDLVQWLADISDQPLDWLELPGDRVNMRSPGRYTVEETRDLFNRYLLARGYTILQIDGGMTIAKTKSINPAIVPRVAASDLVRLPPYTFVRTSLDVGWLSAEKLSEELRPMISENGRLTALTTTNRIEAMDAAINLRQVVQLLEQERSASSRDALAPEFKLRYLPAEEAKQMLEQFLGVEKKQATPLTPQQIQMMQQAARNQPKGAVKPEKKVEIAIVANVRQNSVLIRAPADRVAVALEFLKRVDVPSDSMTNLSDIRTRVQVFRFASLDPEKLLEIVMEMNVLEPTTRISVDDDNNALIVSGSAADRYIIESLIKRLDGSGRSFHVLPLRRLDPAEVAESIVFLMGQDDEDDSDSNSRYSYRYFYADPSEEKKTDEFRVAANTRQRQILLWANDQELAEVESLLIKLGELPPPGGNKRTVRMIDASATPETYEYLKRLQQQWQQLSPAELALPDAERFQDPNEPLRDEDPGEDGENDENATDSEQPESDGQPLPTKSRDDLVTQTVPATSRLTVLQADASDESAGRVGSAESIEAGIDSSVPADTQRSGIRSSADFDRLFGPQPVEPQRPVDRRSNASPIRIELDGEGNLVLRGDDTEALDRLEHLMLQFKPPKRPYRVFHIQHASASWMRINLEDYFADMEDEDSGSDDFMRWYFGFGGSSSNDEKPAGLGEGGKLRIVDDPDTNTLVISGASSEQLRTISELIELWDVPEPVNKRKTRFTKLVHIRYGRAANIAETVKEAYRDLLSSNDKAFAGGKQGRNNGSGANNQQEKSRFGLGSSLESSENANNGGGADFSFKGKLSIGVDEVGNTLLVSVEGEPLLNLITDMVEQLDEAAQPRGEVQVFELPGGISGPTLEQALKSMGMETTTSTEAPSRVAPKKTPAPTSPASDQ